jgi:hypothetical protein
MASPAVALPAFRPAPAPLPAVPFFAARHHNRIERSHSHVAAPGNSPSPRVPHRSPPVSRNHTSPSTEKRNRRHLPPPSEPPPASPIRLPHPSAAAAAPALGRSSAPPIQNVASSSFRHPHRRSRASSRSRPALAPSPLQAIRGRTAFLFYSYSAAPKWTAPPIQNLASSSVGRLCRRSRMLPHHLLPPRQKTSFLHAAFRHDARPDGPRFHERMACCGECSWNQAISTQTYAIIKH